MLLEAAYGCLRLLDDTKLLGLLTGGIPLKRLFIYFLDGVMCESVIGGSNELR